MNELQAHAKTINELLSGAKYSIDFYQREYRWQEKQVRELIEDLTSHFLADYEPGHEREAVESYGHYYLGSIITSKKDNRSFIVDGQQRLTTLTLLLMHLYSLQKHRAAQSTVAELIYSEKFGRKSFNVQASEPEHPELDERRPLLEALFEERPFDTTGQPESIRNMAARYEEIRAMLPADVTGPALPWFIDWLKENVHLVEIAALSDDDAYTIFETMNDRGLSLTPTEMLKGFLLANITDSRDRASANDLWKRRILSLNQIGKDVDADCLKTWLRSQYAETIRERKRGAEPRDFDRLGTEFHRWVSDHRVGVGLNGSRSYVDFIRRDFDFFARHYARLLKAGAKLTPGLEHVFYNAQQGFTLQYQLLLAPLVPGEPDAVLDAKVRLVAMYVDMLLARRIWNFRSVAYSTMQYAVFLVTRDIRRKDPGTLASALRQRIEGEREDFTTQDRFSVHQQNRYFVHNVLARIADYIERESGLTSRYVEYTTGTGQARYEVEHIWADKPERHTDEFAYPQDFRDYRNHIGGLLLLPKSFNASFGDLTYSAKLSEYNSQNLLARTLHPDCYDRNPGFLRFVANSGLPFRPQAEFKKFDLDARQDLYRRIAERIWDPVKLTEAASSIGGS